MSDKQTIFRKARAAVEARPADATEIQNKNRNMARATIIGPVLKSQLVKKSSDGVDDGITTGNTKAIPEDNFLDTLIAANKIVEPPFDPLVLAMLQEHSTGLHGIVEVMEINIDGFGHRLEPRVKLEEAPDDLKKVLEEERIRVTNFFHNCSLDDSFTMIRRKTRHDIEMTGNAYWEIIRSPVTGKIQGINHIPTHQMRLGAQDKEFTEYTRNAHVLQGDGSVELSPEKSFKRFRKFVQAKLGTLSRSFGPGRGHPVRWFKEFMDPRVVDNRDGEYVTDPAKIKALPEKDRASEIIHWRLYNPRSPYGLPRYIGNLITIFGDRAADEINFITLRNNNIPSMAVCVSGGMLTEGSIQRIQEFVETQIQGSENYSRFLLIEAEPSAEGPDQSTGAIKIDIKPLTEQQMRDQMFQEYNKANAGKLLQAWRLPPIFLGGAGDYSKATAEESRRLADEQIFKPERDEFDNKINKLLMCEMGVKFHKFASHGPNVTDDQDLIQVLMAAERTGGMTPQLAREIVGNIMGKELPRIQKANLDPDVPFSLQLAEKVKNQAAMTTGGSPEVGSQVTALKRDIIGQILGHRDALEDEMDRVMAIKRTPKGDE